MDLLKMRGISKDFSGIKANDGVSFTVSKNQIHALLGENGAGKTTLMNILYGLYRPDEGEIWWKGEKIEFPSPLYAINHGIGMVHQHYMLVDKMTGVQNVILGLKLKGYPFLNTAQIASYLKELSTKYGLSVDLNTRVSELSVGEQQRIEILKLLYRKAELLILDEPTAVLTPQETVEFFKMLRTLKNEGHSIVLISHRLSEIMEISDVVTVLRNGRNVATVKTSDTNVNELSRFMVGKELSGALRKDENVGKEICLELSNITLRHGKNKEKLKNICLSVHEGEILGIAGVDGNGQSDLAEVVCGIQKPTSGAVFFKKNDVTAHGIRRRAVSGMAYIADDRHKDGLVLDACVRDNLLLRRYYKPPCSKRGIFRKRVIDEIAKAHVDTYSIKTPGVETKTRNLSGGNQQKIVLARELDASPQLLVAVQPTRGLDIGASEYVRKRLLECRKEGKSILLISTDLEEIMTMSDRIAVMFEGKIMGILENSKDLPAETIGLLMGGKTPAEAT